MIHSLFIFVITDNISFLVVKENFSTPIQDEFCYWRHDTNILKKKRKIKATTLGIMSLDRGYYRDPVRMIKQRVAKYIKTLGEGDGLDLVKIKLGCDGTNLSRNVKLVNFVFSVINEKVNAASVNGCNRIGIFQIEKEDYESTKKWLPVLWDKIKVLKKVFYDKIDKKILENENCK